MRFMLFFGHFRKVPFRFVSFRFAKYRKPPLSPLESEKPEHEATFWSEKKKLNGNNFVELFSSDLDEKMTSAS